MRRTEMDNVILDSNKMIKRNSKKFSEEELESIIKKICRVNRENPEVYSQNEIKKFLDDRLKKLSSLYKQYVSAVLSQEFPIISNNLFNIKRYIAAMSHGLTYDSLSDYPDKREIPLFAYLPISLGLDEKEHFVILGHYSYGDIKVKFPGSIGPRLKNKYRETMRKYFTAIAKAYSEPRITDLLLENKIKPNPEIGLLWIPIGDAIVYDDGKTYNRKKTRKPEVPVNPAVILKVQGKKYFAGTYKPDRKKK